MNVGEAVLTERKRRGMSRKQVAELTGLTVAKVANIEKGRELKGNERELLRSFIDVDSTTQHPQLQGFSDEAQARVELPPDPTIPTDFFELRAQAQASYDQVQARLAGRPARTPWPTLYRLDAAPPTDLERVIRWAQEENRWLDKVDGQMTPDAAVYLLDEDEEVQFIDVEPSEVVVDLMGRGGPPTVTVDITAAQPVVSTPIETPRDQESLGVASPTVTAVGVDALHQDGLRRVSNSELQTFKHCRRRWWLAWYRGLRLKTESQVGVAQLGDRVHRALAAWYVPDGQVRTDPREALELELTRDEALMVQQVATQDASDAATTLAQFQKDADTARAMVEGYVDWVAETGADQGYQVVAPEAQLTGTIELPGDAKPLKLTGKLDVRLRREHDGVHLFQDHKTVGDFNRPARTLPLDEQMKTYHLLEELNRDSSEPRVEGALYNMLRRVKRTATAKPPFYMRLEVRHNEHSITNFKERLIGEGLELDRVESALVRGVSHQRVVYPTPTQDCSWKCEFNAVCSMFDDASRAEDFISEHYVQVNPLARYDDEKPGGTDGTQ